MNSHLKKFISRGALISLILLIAGGILFTTLLKEYFSFSLPVLLLVIFFTTVLFHRYLVYNSEKEGRKFPAKFMVVTGIKMGFYLLIIIVYVLIKTENAIPFLICFIVFYIIFSVFEIVSFVNYIKSSNNK